MKNTAIQEAINEIKSKALAETYKSSEYWAYIECIQILESNLEKEKQDLIDAKQEGYADGYQDATNDILSSI